MCVPDTDPGAQTGPMKLLWYFGMFVKTLQRTRILKLLLDVVVNFPSLCPLLNPGQKNIRAFSSTIFVSVLLLSLSCRS